VTCLCTAILVYSLRHWLVSFFTTDPELHAVAVATFIIVPTHIMIDSAQGCLSGVIRGLGKENYGSVLCLIAYYPITLPFSFLLGFYCNY